MYICMKYKHEAVWVNYSIVYVTVKTSGSETLNISFTCLMGRCTMQIRCIKAERLGPYVLSMLKISKETIDSCLGDLLLLH